MYKCSKCFLKVVIINNEIIRACNCNVGIILEMTASVKGIGGLSNK